MVLKLTDLVTKVRIKMNEDPKDPGFENGVGPQGLTLNQIIAAVADEEISDVIESTVFTGFDDLQKFFGAIEVREGVGRIPIPGDFHRFVELKISCWDIPATEAHSPGDEDYWRRSSISKIARGTRKTPRVYVVRESEGNWLELYPCKDGAKIEYGNYLSNPLMTPVGSYYIPDRMVGPVTTAIARRVTEILRENK